MSFDLDVPGHAQWLLLSLAEDVDSECEARFDELTTGQATPEFRAETVALMAGLSRAVQGKAISLAEEEVAVVGAWMLMPAPGLLLPGPVATLQYAALPPGWGVREVATRGWPERHGQPVVTHLDTASGPAFAIRDRPVEIREDRRVVHETRSVVWIRPDTAESLMLTLSSADLVQAAVAAEPLAELAATVRWSG